MKNAPRILTIGSGLVDVFVQSPLFQLDNQGTLCFTAAQGKLEVSSLVLKTGGGGGNTAVCLARLGLEVRIISELGSDEFATLVRSDLEHEQVDTAFLVAERKEQTGGSVILVAPTGERLVLVHRGAAAQLNPHDIQPAAFNNLDWVYLSSISGQVDTLQAIGEALSKNSLVCTWNPGFKELEALTTGLLAWDTLPIGILLLNKEEWQSISALHQQFLEKTPLIVVTDGANGGTVYRQGEEPHHYQVEKVPVQDTTGAGDAFGATFTAALLYGHSVATAIEQAKQNAGSVVQYLGAKPGLLHKEALF